MPDPLPENPYKVLGVPKNAEVGDIKKAYRKLVLTCHPDKTGSLPETLKKEKDEQFHKVQKAHDLLTNELERQRYDDRIQLEELRSELKRDVRKDVPLPLYKAATFSSRMPSRPSPSKTTSPIFDTRGPPIYETRAPKGSYDDEYQPSGRYETYRQTSSSKKHDDRFHESTGSRRSSGRVADEKKFERRDDDDDYYSKKTRQKEAKQEQRHFYNDRKKSRDKTRRSDIETKRYARVDTDSESDSEIEVFMSTGRPFSSRRKIEEIAPRRPRFEEHPRRTRSPSSSDSEDDPRLAEATSHIAKSGTRVSSEPKASKGRSGRTPPPPPPPPPPQPPMAPKAEATKRPTTRRTPTSSKSTKKVLEVVDPPSKDYDYDDYEPPRRVKAEPVSSSRSSPKASALKNVFSRASSFNNSNSPDKPAPPKRSLTTPHGTALGNTPARSSKLKQSHTTRQQKGSDDSDLGSPPDTATPRYTSTMYRVESESDSDDAEVRKPRIVSVEPHDLSGGSSGRRDRDKDHGTTTRDRPSRREGSSPRSPSFVETREPHRSSHRAEPRNPPVRSNTFDSAGGGTTRERSRHKHSTSAEGGGGNSSGGGGGGGGGGGSSRLFCEITPEQIKTARNIDKADGQFAYARRGSADSALPTRDRGDRDRHRDRDRDRAAGRERVGKDDYPYERARERRGSSGNPGMGSRSNSYMQDIRAA